MSRTMRGEYSRDLAKWDGSGGCVAGAQRSGVIHPDLIPVVDAVLMGLTPAKAATRWREMADTAYHNNAQNTIRAVADAIESLICVNVELADELIKLQRP